MVYIPNRHKVIRSSILKLYKIKPFNNPIIGNKGLKGDFLIKEREIKDQSSIKGNEVLDFLILRDFPAEIPINSDSPMDNQIDYPIQEDLPPFDLMEINIAFSVYKAIRRKKPKDPLEP